MGNDSTIAFFEIPKGKEPTADRNAIGSMQHCSLSWARRGFVKSNSGSRLMISLISAQFRGDAGTRRYATSMIQTVYAWNLHAKPPTAMTPMSSTVARTSEAEALRGQALTGVDEAWLNEVTESLPD